MNLDLYKYNTYLARNIKKYQLINTITKLSKLKVKNSVTIDRDARGSYNKDNPNNFKTIVSK